MPSDKFSIDGLDGYKFEELIAKIMKRKGYLNICVTQKSRDTGKDILMEDSDENIIVVECKHQKFVGRPIIQKLQGAMIHEEGKRSGHKIKGMIVTSGDFSDEAKTYVKEISQEIELISGKQLKQICADLGVVIINGKVQIISDKSYPNISESDSCHYLESCYNKIYGNNFFFTENKSFLLASPSMLC